MALRRQKPLLLTEAGPVQVGPGWGRKGGQSVMAYAGPRLSGASPSNPIRPQAESAPGKFSLQAVTGSFLNDSLSDTRKLGWARTGVSHVLSACKVS